LAGFLTGPIRIKGVGIVGYPYFSFPGAIPFTPGSYRSSRNYESDP
jgi:hypothetical protein